MSAFDVWLGFPGLAGLFVYVIVQVLLNKFSPLVRFAVCLIATLASFATGSTVAKLQGYDWVESIEGGMVSPFISLLIDLSFCSMVGNCRSSVKKEADLRRDFDTAMKNVAAFTGQFGVNTETKKKQ